MFNKISALFHQAAEFSSQVLTTEVDEIVSTRDDFKLHWKTITDTITDNGPITDVRENLEEMVEFLCSEEESVDPNDPGTVGPCLEFLLRHKLLDTLFTSAKNDYPTGMTQQVLNFFTVLLGRLERPILHHVSIHQPISLQVSACGEDPSFHHAPDQVQFIRTLCLRLTKDPRLADLFMKETRDNKKVFLLSEALIRLSNSADGLVAMKAYESLLTCVSLHHSSVTKALAYGEFPMLLASKLQYHFQLIPTNTAYTTILTCQAGWGVDYADCCHSLDQSSSSNSDLWHVEAFFSWLDYCGQIIGSSEEPLSKAVCDSIHEIFLSASLLRKLLKNKEEEILISTSVLARALQAVHCRRLLEELILFTLKDSCVMESVGAVDPSPMALLDKLTSRIDHINEDVCQVTLRLFDILFLSPLPGITEKLTDSEPFMQQWYIMQPDMMHAVRVQLEEDITAYLSLIPDCLSSSKSINGEYRLADYLKEAHSRVTRNIDVYSNTVETPLPTTSGTQSKHETPFISMLFNKLETLLDQPYEVNLLVTSLLIKLACSPCQDVSWLFEIQTVRRNVYTILKKVADTLHMRVERTPGLVVHIVEARRRLEGQRTSDLLSMPHNDLFEGAIILEEVIKELCSALFEKTSLSILTLPSN